MGEETGARVSPRGGEDEVDHGEGGGGLERGGDDISRRTLGDRTNSPSSQRTEFRASFFVSPLLFYLIISRSPSFPGGLPSDPSRPLAPEHSRPRLSPITNHAVLALRPHPHRGHAPHCASLSPPARPSLTIPRAPATPYGASGRCVVPAPSHTPTLILRTGHAMRRELRRP